MINDKNVATTYTLEVPHEMCVSVASKGIFTASLGGLPLKGGSNARSVHADSLTTLLQ
jgi:hypothetical protein